jgi:hypothetical protein
MGKHQPIIKDEAWDSGSCLRLSKNKEGTTNARVAYIGVLDSWTHPTMGYSAPIRRSRERFVRG